MRMQTVPIFLHQDKCMRLTFLTWVNIEGSRWEVRQLTMRKPGYYKIDEHYFESLFMKNGKKIWLYVFHDFVGCMPQCILACCTYTVFSIRYIRGSVYFVLFRLYKEFLANTIPCDLMTVFFIHKIVRVSVKRPYKICINSTIRKTNVK